MGPIFVPEDETVQVSQIYESPSWSHPLGTDSEGKDALSSTRTFLHDIYPRLLAWHRYLLTYRDPEESGLVTIYHPWESGTDNSPRVS